MVIYIYLQQHYPVWSLVTIVVCQIIREKTHKRFATFQYAIIVNFLSLKNSWFGLPRDSSPFSFRMEFYLSLYLRNTLPSTKESTVLYCQLHLDIVSGLLPQNTGTSNLIILEYRYKCSLNIKRISFILWTFNKHPRSKAA